MNKNSIAFKSVLLILAFVIPVVIVLAWFSHKIASDIILEQTEKQAETIVQAAVERILLITEPIEKIPRHIADSLIPGSHDIVKILKISLESNENIFGMAAAFEPYRFDPSVRQMCPYVYRSKGQINTTTLADPSYDYMKQDWYRIPKLSMSPEWSEPYFDRGGGNVLMSTFSYPVIRNRQFMGVITADLAMSHLHKIVSGIHVLNSGYAFLVTARGSFISHPDSRLVMRKTLGEYASKSSNKQLMKIASDIEKGKTGFSGFTLNKKKFQVYYHPIRSTGWTIGVVFPDDELFAPLKQLTRKMLFVSIPGLALLILAVAWAAGKITARISRLSKISDIIAKGDFTSPLPEDTSTDELGKLSRSFKHMQQSLKSYMDDLETAIAARQRIESELGIAREIQMSILPKIFPPFPDQPEIDIHAVIRPAREVGGDFYDFFFIDEKHFCFVIGDVSGKGIPASLLKAVAKTLLKAGAMPGISPADILSKVNNELAEANEACMFVTVFLAVLNLETGSVKYCNAGHNPPLFKTCGKCMWICTNNQPALGVFPEVSYRTEQVCMAENDYLLLYTDGTNEAFNTAMEQFSSRRLRECFEKSSGSPESITRHILADIQNFVDEAAPSDDMTMLCIRYNGTSTGN